jgi:CRISPR-associated endonuclease/helicase Cas3
VLEQKQGQKDLYELANRRCIRLPDEILASDRIQSWGGTDYMATLTDLATALDLSLTRCAERFCVVTVRPNDNGWRYHPALGFAKRLA